MNTSNPKVCLLSQRKLICKNVIVIHASISNLRVLKNERFIFMFIAYYSKSVTCEYIKTYSPPFISKKVDLQKCHWDLCINFCLFVSKKIDLQNYHRDPWINFFYFLGDNQRNYISLSLLSLLILLLSF